MDFIETVLNTKRGLILRLVQFFLGFDGILHIIEVVSAIEEGANRTAVLTFFHATIFFIGMYFIGHDHRHHDNH